MADVGVWVDAVGDVVGEALVVGVAATLVFCALAGVAVALWAGVPWWAGLLAGVVLNYGGLLVLLAVGAARSARRASEARAARAGGPPLVAGWSGPAAPTVSGQGTPRVGTSPRPRTGRGEHPPGWGVPELPPATTTAGGRAAGVRATVGRGWRRWTRTPPTRGEWAVAVLALLLAGGLVAATQVTWLTVSAVGFDVTGVGPFAIQLGLFVVVSAVVALVCAAGVLRWRSAWWPVLLAWCGTWWALIGIEVVRQERSLDALNRLLRDQVRDRTGYDVRPEVDLGVGWTMMIGLAGAMLLLAVVLLVLQGRRGAHYRLVARS